MRISDRYIGWQVLRGTLIAVMALSMLLVLGRIFQEIRPMVVEQNVPLPLVGRFILNVFPLSLMFTIPWGFMAAVLLVFGRLARDQEMGALQLSGMSMPRIALPVFVIGALLSWLCVWINVSLVPRSNAAVNSILYDAVRRDPRSLITPGVITSQLANLRVFVQERQGDHVRSLHVYRLPDASKNERYGEYIYAEDAAIAVDQERQQIKLTLNSTYIEKPDQQGNLDIYVASAAPWRLDLTEKKRLRSGAMTNEELRQLIKDPQSNLNNATRVKYETEIAQRYAFALASFSFAWIAVPLSLGRRRKDGNGGMLMALLIGAGYFLLNLLAQKSTNTATATLILWMPNFLCILLGSWLFWRVRFR